MEDKEKKPKVKLENLEENKELDEKEMDKTKGGVEFLISASSNNNIILEGEINTIKPDDGAMA